MPETITCPMCNNRVELEIDDARSLCPDCLDEDDLGAEVQRRVERALWTAVRSLEEQATWVSWKERAGKPLPVGAETLRTDADLLRTVLERSRSARAAATGGTDDGGTPA